MPRDIFQVVWDPTNKKWQYILNGAAADDLDQNIILVDGTEGAPSLRFDLDGDTGLWRPGDNRIQISTAGASRWEIDASGHLLAVDDNTYDIGASGATRPRDIYVADDIVAGGDISAGGWLSGDRPSCRIHFAGDQTVATATWLDVLYDQEYHDNNALHDTVSNTDRITIPSDGIYCFGAHLVYYANATGTRYLYVTLNDVAPPSAIQIAEVKPANVGPGNQGWLDVSGIAELSSGDILRVCTYQNSGGNLNLYGTTTLGAPYANSFWCFKVSD